jgi:F-type H+-transporting ATPase subunit epsilon
MAATLKLEIVTPERTAFSGDVYSVVMPTVDGEIGVFPDHIPLITAIEPGELVVAMDGGKQEYLAVGEGFVEVTGDHVWVMTDMAIEMHEIDEDAAKKAIERAKRAMEEKLSAEEHAATKATLARSLAQLKLTQRRRPGG